MLFAKTSPLDGHSMQIHATAVLALGFFTSNLFAASLNGSSTGYDWRAASQVERKVYVADVLRRVNASYPPAEMLACFKEVFANPVKPYIHGQSLATAAAICHSQIKDSY